LPGKRHSKETKATAIAAVETGSSNVEAGKIAGVPESTVRFWLQKFRESVDSELEAYVASEKRVINATWCVIGGAAQALALDLAAEGNAKGMLSAAMAAGIASTKLEALGQPKNVTPQSSPGPVFTPSFTHVETPATPVDTHRTAQEDKEV